MARPKLKQSCEISQHPWDQFESFKEQSYLYIDQALLLEKTDTPSRALVMYQKGLDCLDKALSLPVELPGSTSESLKKIRKSRAKMSRTRQQIVFRIQELSPSQSHNSVVESPQNIKPRQTQWSIFPSCWNIVIWMLHMLDALFT